MGNASFLMALVRPIMGVSAYILAKCMCKSRINCGSGRPNEWRCWHTHTHTFIRIRLNICGRIAHNDRYNFYNLNRAHSSTYKRRMTPQSRAHIAGPYNGLPVHKIVGDIVERQDVLAGRWRLQHHMLNLSPKIIPFFTMTAALPAKRCEESPTIIDRESDDTQQQQRRAHTQTKNGNGKNGPSITCWVNLWIVTIL